MKLPYDFELYPLSFMFPFSVDLTKMGHGPRRQLKWYEVKFLRTGVNGHEDKPRLWVYTRWGAFFFDWQWIVV